MMIKTHAAAAMLCVGVLLLVPQLGFAQSEGIKVHGDWTIVVKEPDGTVVSRHEFQNALKPSGKTALAGLVSGQARFGTWEVWLQGVGGPCGLSAQSSDMCRVMEEADQPLGSSSNFFYTLTRTAVDSTVKLEGTARMRTANAGDDSTGIDIGNINTVVTRVVRCQAEATPCTMQTPGASVHFFTEKILTNPIPVTSRQLIEVKVVLSFQ
jgi:hypothetical protein